MTDKPCRQQFATRGTTPVLCALPAGHDGTCRPEGWTGSAEQWVCRRCSGTDLIGPGTSCDCALGFVQRAKAARSDTRPDRVALAMDAALLRVWSDAVAAGTERVRDREATAGLFRRAADALQRLADGAP